MKKKKIWMGIGGFILGVVATLIATITLNYKGNTEQSTIIAPEVYGETASINQVFEALKEYHYFYGGDDQALIDGAISGMIAALDDPHSTYFTQKDYASFMEHLEEKYSGIGCEVTSINGYTIIVSAFPDSPADLAGIMANDVVIEVDGENVVGQNLQDVTNKIKGQKGTTVTLGIQRDENAELIKIEVTRDEIAQETVKTEILEISGEKVGYLQVTTFGENTANEFKEGIEGLEKEGMTSLIVDLRNNSGGYLQSVVDMVDYLLPSGKNITTIENRDEQGKTYTTSGSGKDYKVTTLINEGSASASEIFAAAMKEAGGFDVVGTTSYGKGTVQVSMPLDDHSSLKLTTQVWKTPDMNWINEVGVEPTITVEAPDFYSFYQVYLTDGKTFEYDMVDVGIKNAQDILKTLDYSIDRTDGYFNQTTVTAVKQFQKDHDLDQTGTIDAATAKSLTLALREKIKDKQFDTQLQEALEVAVK
ncbi:MAG TPA: peptidase S41 [Firmicutes bacterium]|nr:peptidase S41 [Bacillota bacterium]